MKFSSTGRTSHNQAHLSKNPLIDKFGRTIDYVRISLTDRCNLRCTYCMPENMKFLPKAALLTFEEIARLTGILAALGIRKVRVTGGEPFVRKDTMSLLNLIANTNGIEQIHITTNGVLTAPLIPALKELNIAGINLSLDTLDGKKFFEITRRNEFDAVLECFHACLAHEIPLKVNMVVMEGINTDEIITMCELAREHPISVRFIEEMPFNGTNKIKESLKWSHQEILLALTSHYGKAIPLESVHGATATNFKLPGFAGTVGIIAGFTRTFCGTCNRIRVTSRGELQTCLYGASVLDFKELLRSGVSDDEIEAAIRQAVSHRFQNGHEAEKHRGTASVSNSMSLIGG